jgi:DNA-binding NarL/FixJ family response regulator
LFLLGMHIPTQPQLEGRIGDYWLLNFDLELKRSVDVVVGMAQGKMTKDIAQKYHITPARIVQLKRKMGNQIKQAWGDQAVAQATTKPAWRRALDNRKW